jgi:hypothetical protein
MLLADYPSSIHPVEPYITPEIQLYLTGHSLPSDIGFYTQALQAWNPLAYKHGTQWSKFCELGPYHP